MVFDDGSLLVTVPERMLPSFTDRVCVWPEMGVFFVHPQNIARRNN
jgi:hypothetical protein